MPKRYAKRIKLRLMNMRYIDSEISDLRSNVAEVQRYQIKLAGYNNEVKKISGPCRNHCH
jgi:hypothetical protein